MEGPRNGLEQGRFPGAIGANNGNQLSLVHLEGDIVNDGDATVSNLNLRDL